MNVLLINPKDGDFIRVQHILKKYKAERMHEMPVRPRYKFVCYATTPDFSDQASVWHSGKQITIHFGSDPE